jgi:hypothetical protein
VDAIELIQDTEINQPLLSVMFAATQKDGDNFAFRCNAAQNGGGSQY